MKIVITGATGYIGSRLAQCALDRGAVVVSASRRPPARQEFSWIPWDITSDQPIQLPVGTTAVIHLAANTSSDESINETLEVDAAENLISAASAARAKFIFVSSQAARQGAPTEYGRIKWRIEGATQAARGWVIRPGQVYGGELRGLFGQMANLIRQLPAIPAFLPAPLIQPIHVDDLADAMLCLVERDDVPSGIISLGAPEPVSFSSFLSELARSRLRCSRMVIPIPRLAVRMATAIIGPAPSERLGLTRLQSLFDLPTMASGEDLMQLGIRLRPLQSGMHSSGNDRRRRLLREGFALTSYVLKASPGPAVLRRYVRALEALGNAAPLDLPPVVYTFPLTIALIGDIGRRANHCFQRDLAWRIDVATLLAEATPMGAVKTLRLGKGKSLISCLLGITGNVLSEAILQTLRVALRWTTRLWSKELP